MCSWRHLSARAMLAATGFVLLSVPSAPAQVTAGRLEERIRSATDTSQTFALFLPPGYTPERRWPVLFVLDPRGRALLGLNLFQDAAARLGWVVLSAYNTLSDGPPEPNVNAVNAMLAWAQAHPSLDPTRLYLAGFSGTARAALGFAVALRGHVAGVIAVGGALGFALGGPETAFAGDSTFAYFGAAGTRDFNYEEVLAMGDRFRTTRVPFRVAAFDGPHTWPPPDLCGDVLDWLELRAMLGGLRAMDSGWVRARLAGEVTRAVELERAGRWADALRLNDAIARDYTRWPEARDAAGRAAALRSSPVLAKYEAEAHRLAERDLRQGIELPKIFAWARSQREPPSLAALAGKPPHRGAAAHGRARGQPRGGKRAAPARPGLRQRGVLRAARVCGERLPESGATHVRSGGDHRPDPRRGLCAPAGSAGGRDGGSASAPFGSVRAREG